MNETHAARRILMVDDEAFWTDFAVHNLDTFDVVVARNHEEAVEQLKRSAFDAVILDAHYLPYVREIRPSLNERVAVATFAPTLSEARNAYREGASHYFAKSFSRRDLLRELKQLMPEMRVG